MSEAQLVTLDLEEIFCYLLSGGMRSGKSAALRLLAHMAAESEVDICIIDTSTQFSQYASDNNMTCLVTADEIFDWMEQTLVPEFQRRNENIRKAGGRKFSKQAQENEKQMIVLIHDLDGFINLVNSDERDMTSFLEAMVRRGNGHKIAIAAVVSRDDSTAHSHNPIYSGLVSWKTGLHLGGQVDNQRVLDFDVNYSEGSKKLPPGYGHTVVGTNTVLIVLPEA
jgi:S-DNA-T family DNA segregation ATPase FtsK/SpoIIIE